MKRLTFLAVCLVTLVTSAASVAGVHFGFNVGMPRPICRPIYVAPQPCYLMRQRPCYVVAPRCCHPVRKVHKVCYHAPRPRVGFNIGFGF